MAVEQIVVCGVGKIARNCGRVDAILCRRIAASGNNTVRQVRSNGVRVGRLESWFHLSRSLRKADNLMAWMVFLKSCRKELSGEHLQVVVDRKDRSF